jgi:hypothetical protein
MITEHVVSTDGLAYRWQDGGTAHSVERDAPSYLIAQTAAARYCPEAIVWSYVLLPAAPGVPHGVCSPWHRPLHLTLSAKLAAHRAPECLEQPCTCQAITYENCYEMPIHASSQRLSQQAG